MLINATVTLTDAHLIEEEVNIVKQDAIPVANLSTSILENSKSAQILVFKFLQQHSDSLIGELKALEEKNTTTLKKTAKLFARYATERADGYPQQAQCTLL